VKSSGISIGEGAQCWRRAHFCMKGSIEENNQRWRGIKAIEAQLIERRRRHKQRNSIKQRGTASPQASAENEKLASASAAS